METFLQISIVGTVLSLAVQYIKNKFGTTSIATKTLTVLLSVLIGAGFYFLQGTEIWLAIVGVLGVASTVYAFIFKK